MLHRARTAADRNAASAGSMLPSCTSRPRVMSIWPCRRRDTHGRGVSDIVAVIRELPVSATLTSGAAAEKSRPAARRA